MPEFTSHADGSPCWVDLMSPDVGGSAAFYTGVFGWDAEDQHDDEGNRIYTLFSLGGKSVAGLGGQPPEMAGMPPIWNNYVCCRDLDGTVGKVEAAGGSVMMPPMQVMDAGSMAIVADPTGAVISLWKPGEHIGAEICNEPNTWSWSELLTRDVDAARPFYEQVLGWEIVGQDMGEMGTYWVVRGGEHGGWGGIMAMPPDVPDMVPNYWATYFATADVKETLDKVKANGGETVAEPMTIPGVGTIAVVNDAQGGNFSLMQPEQAG